VLLLLQNTRCHVRRHNEVVLVVAQRLEMVELPIKSVPADRQPALRVV
jgi:hypothetical protein